MNNNSYTIPVEYNQDTDEYFISLNDEILNQVGWKIGDTLVWTQLTDNSWTLTKKVVDQDIFLVETVSLFRHRYAIRAENAEQARKKVESQTANEISQLSLGEQVLSSRQITENEYLEIFDNDNDYLKSWTDDLKLSRITGHDSV